MHEALTVLSSTAGHGGTHLKSQHLGGRGESIQSPKSPSTAQLSSGSAWAKQDPVKEWGKENVFLKAVINKIPTDMCQGPKGLGGSELHS